MSTPEELKRRHRRERIVAASVIVFIAAIGIAAWVYVKLTDDEFAGPQAYVPRPTKITPEVELLQRYIRFDTSNPPGNELPAAQWLQGVLRANGVAAEIIESAPRRANVYARIKGREQGPGLMLLHHIDVVPASAEGWTLPPFSAEIRLDQLYGRGALDMKGTGIAFLRAFLDVAKSGRAPKHDLVFLAVADEETGSEFGVKWLLANRPDVLAGIAYALNEGGITEMQQERVTYYGIEIGTKITSVVNLVAPDRQRLQTARIALEPRISPVREPERVLPEVKRFFRDIAPHRIEFRDELADVEQTIAAGKFWRLPIGYRELTQNNVFPEAVVQRAAGGFQMRTLLLSLPGQNPDPLIAEIEKTVRPYGVAVEVVQSVGPVPVSPIDTPFWKLLSEQAAAEFGSPVGTEILNRAENDSRYLRQRGIVAYGILPFAADFFQTEAIHGTDERLRVEYFVKGVEFIRKTVAAWAEG